MSSSIATCTAAAVAETVPEYFPGGNLWEHCGLLAVEPHCRETILDLLGDGPPGCTRYADVPESLAATPQAEIIWCGNVRKAGTETVRRAVRQQLVPSGRIYVHGWTSSLPYFIPYRLAVPPGLMDRVHSALRRTGSIPEQVKEAAQWERSTALRFLEELDLVGCRLMSVPTVLRHPLPPGARTWLEAQWAKLATDGGLLAELTPRDGNQLKRLLDPCDTEYILSRPDFLYVRYDSVVTAMKPGDYSRQP